MTSVVRTRWPNLVRVVAIGVIVATPLAKAVSGAGGTSFSGHADLFGWMMINPVEVLFPLIVVLLTCLPLSAALQENFIAHTRARRGPRALVARHIAIPAAVGGAIMFVYGLVTFVVAFYAWPAFGDPGIDPAGYNLTPAAELTERVSDSSANFLLAFGEWAFGLGYSLWLVCNAAACAAMGACFLLLVSHRLLALALPFAVYFGGSIVAAVIGEPFLAPMFSLVPFGLETTTPLRAAAPCLALMVVAAVLTTVVVTAAPRNTRLT